MCCPHGTWGATTREVLRRYRAPFLQRSLTITPLASDEMDLRQRLSAPALNMTQDLFVSAGLPQTRRVMVKDEDICLHCGLCAERCPTAAWDMKKFELVLPYSSANPAEVTA